VAIGEPRHPDHGPVERRGRDRRDGLLAVLEDAGLQPGSWPRGRADRACRDVRRTAALERRIGEQAVRALRDALARDRGEALG
jgi:hypothetical protein